MVDLLFRVACHGGGDEGLNIHLKRITDSAYTRRTLGGAEIDGELIAPVIQESHDVDDRCQIMGHVRECLSEASGKRWQRIYGGLALIEKLLEHGSPALAIEVAHGHHFDLVQKVSLLKYFDAAARGCTDRRAQNAVRGKASELLETLIPQLQRASAEELPHNAGLNRNDSPSSKDTSESVKSKESTATASTTASTAASSSTGGARSVSTSIPEEPDTELDKTGADSKVDNVTAPSSKLHIDESFSDLRAWMGSGRSSSCASSAVSGRSSEADDSDWEPIGQLPTETDPSGDRSPRIRQSSEMSDAFYTPMPTPALKV